MSNIVDLSSLPVSQTEVAVDDVHEPSLLPAGKTFKLVWSDEFDGTELDRSKWNFRLNFWGRPFVAYSDGGIVLDGKSNLEIHPVILPDGRRASAQLQTGANSFDAPKGAQPNVWGIPEIWPLGTVEKPNFMHRYGYYECRCKLQQQQGWWSAFWTQAPSIGTTYDPTYSGIESDIMECFKPEEEVTSGNIFGGYGKQLTEEARIKYPIGGGWHRFGMLWNEDGYVFYCDGKETVRTSEHISKVEQFILLTTEIKGYRAGDMTQCSEEARQLGADDAFVVDYVRVFDEV